MKQFVWRLQRVLDVKARQEQIRKAELIAITQKLTQTRGELLAKKRILEEIISDLSDTSPRKRLGQQEFFIRHSKAADEQIREIEKIISSLELLRKEKTTEVLQVRKFREGLEKLRTEAKAKFIEEQEKLEQKELDEIAILRFTRKNDLILQHNGNTNKEM